MDALNVKADRGMLKMFFPQGSTTTRRCEAPTRPVAAVNECMYFSLARLARRALPVHYVTYESLSFAILPLAFHRPDVCLLTCCRSQLLPHGVQPVPESHLGTDDLIKLDLLAAEGKSILFGCD